MERVDAVIIGLGVLAVVATVLGLVYYASVDGARDITYVHVESPLADTGATGATGTTEMAWQTPDNATGAAVDVTVSTASPGNGQATVHIELVGPDGASFEQTFSFAVGPQGGQGTFTIEGSWLDLPADTRADPATFDNTRAWDADIQLRVTVEMPGVSPLPLPVPQTYDVAASGVAMVYQHTIDQPDPRAA